MKEDRHSQALTEPAQIDVLIHHEPQLWFNDRPNQIANKSKHFFVKLFFSHPQVPAKHLQPLVQVNARQLHHHCPDRLVQSRCQQVRQYHLSQPSLGKITILYISKGSLNLSEIQTPIVNLREKSLKLSAQIKKQNQAETGTKKRRRKKEKILHQISTWWPMRCL